MLTGEWGEELNCNGMEFVGMGMGLCPPTLGIGSFHWHTPPSEEEVGEDTVLPLSVSHQLLLGRFLEKKECSHHGQLHTTTPVGEGRVQGAGVGGGVRGGMWKRAYSPDYSLMVGRHPVTSNCCSLQWRTDTRESSPAGIASCLQLYASPSLLPPSVPPSSIPPSLFPPSVPPSLLHPSIPPSLPPSLPPSDLPLH